MRQNASNTRIHSWQAVYQWGPSEHKSGECRKASRAYLRGRVALRLLRCISLRRRLLRCGLLRLRRVPLLLRRLLRHHLRDRAPYSREAGLFKDSCRFPYEGYRHLSATLTTLGGELWVAAVSRVTTETHLSETHAIQQRPSPGASARASCLLLAAEVKAAAGIWTVGAAAVPSAAAAAAEAAAAAAAA